ncbi:MAG: hypothetical protein JSS30_00580 [Verrucomicrobia bacterium]|nr:hypothetical protein [Verrucomicrobiota bacterium]
MKQLQSQLKLYLTHPLAWIIGGVSCCVLVLLYHFSAEQKLDRLTATAIQLKTRQTWTAERDRLEGKLQQQLKIADRDYIEKELESLQFLNLEAKRLQASLRSDPNSGPITERLEFLSSAQNRLHFREQNFQRIKGYQEVDVIQDHPVEMNRDDLKKLLARIENKTIGPFHPGPNPPDLLIKKFELIKKPMSSTEETYLINLELSKFEMLHE